MRPVVSTTVAFIFDGVGGFIGHCRNVVFKVVGFTHIQPDK